MRPLSEEEQMHWIKGRPCCHFCGAPPVMIAFDKPLFMHFCMTMGMNVWWSIETFSFDRKYAEFEADRRKAEFPKLSS